MFVTIFAATLAAFVPYGYALVLVAGWILARVIQMECVELYADDR